MDLTGKIQLLLLNFIPLITFSDLKKNKYTIFLPCYISSWKINHYR